jgi:hypothetical protein
VVVALGLAAGMIVLPEVGQAERERERVDELSCYPHTFPAAALHAPRGAERGTDGAAGALRDRLGTEHGRKVLPQTGWRRLKSSADSVLFGNWEAENKHWTVWVSRFPTGGWRYEGVGLCHEITRMRHGLRPSSWRLVRGTRLTSDRRVFRVLVTETACAGGTKATGRILRPLILRDREKVKVAMFVRPRRGASTCPGNPPTPYVLRLERPLGDRALVDGGTVPAKPVGGQLRRAEYQRAITGIVRDTAKPTRLYSKLVVRKRPVRECSRLMTDFYGEVYRLVERVAALDAPTNAAPIQADFLEAARQSVHRVATIDGKVRVGKVRCGRQLNDLLYGMPSTKRAERAIDRLERRGYRVFGE